MSQLIGQVTTEDGELLYACLGRVPGAAPGMGLDGVDRVTADRWARKAVQQLLRLHEWTPVGQTATVLRETLDHGGFVGRSQLLGEIQSARDLDGGGIVPREVLDGLVTIADRAPEYAGATVPVHADCHWGNWLVHDGAVTALLDFEWARFGEPADDWVFLARFSGPHMQTVLSVITELTGMPLETLRAACEVREATYLTSDLRLKFQEGHDLPLAATRNIRELEELVVGRSWWQLEA